MNIFRTLCSSVFNVEFEYVIVHRVGFFHYKHQSFYGLLHWKCYFSSKFWKEWLFFKDFFCPRFKSHFRLVQMTLKSITFVKNHKVIEHFYYNNVHLNDIFHFVSVRNSSLRKQISCVKIKGAIIIHVKFSGARKLKILGCLRTLHVQILSGFKNWDIQDLTLTTCDTLKSCPWNFFKFCWVVHYRKICKNEV